MGVFSLCMCVYLFPHVLLLHVNGKIKNPIFNFLTVFVITSQPVRNNHYVHFEHFHRHLWKVQSFS